MRVLARSTSKSMLAVSAVMRSLARTRVAVALALGSALLLGFPWSVPSQARTSEAGRANVPGVVRKVLPAVVSITTRQIEHDQFNQPVPTRGLGSGVIVDRRGDILEECIEP
jgi:S1-C subfamily serine protease